MNERQLLEVIHLKTLTIDKQTSLFSVPLTCSLSEADYQRCKDQKAVSLVNEQDEILGVIRNPTFFQNRQEEICARVLGTQSKLHPKAELILQEQKWLITGSSLRVVNKILWKDGLDDLRMDPT